MDATHLKNVFHIGPHELPDPTGTVAEIASIDTEYYQGIDNGRHVDKCRHQLWLKGCRVPLRLNNTRIDILTALFGRETDGWIGRKIGLFVGAGNAYGKTEPTVMMHVQPVDAHPLTEWPERIRTRGGIAGGGSGAGFTLAGPSGPRFGGAFGGGGVVQAPQSLPAVQSATPSGTLGHERASMVLALLKQRGRTLDQLVAHLARSGVEIGGLHPGEIPASAEQSIREFLRGLPKTVDVDVEAEAKKTLASWKPPAIVDRGTGEVMPSGGPLAGEVIHDDEIPF